MRKTVTSRIGQRMKDRETLIGSSPRAARKQGIRMRPRATAADGTTVTFADGSALAVDARRVGDRLPARPLLRRAARLRRRRARLRHRRGVTEVPGLYFLGLPWQHTRGSALLGWVKDDAQFIAQRIADAARSRADAGVPAPALSGPSGR